MADLARPDSEPQLGVPGGQVAGTDQAAGSGDGTQGGPTSGVVTLPVGIHQHRGRPGCGAEHLLGEPVEFAERSVRMRMTGYLLRL